MENISKISDKCMGSIKENYQRCLEKIAEAAVRNGKNPDDIALVAVTKNVPSSRINEGIEAGIKFIGENKVQEARNKKEFVKAVSWHMVGHLQTNKVKYAVELFDVIQSVDSVHLAKEINKRCEQHRKKMPVLIEVNTSGETSKYGYSSEKVVDFIGEIQRFTFLDIKGLMTIGLFSKDPEKIRPCFIQLRELAEYIVSQRIPDVKMDILSMGMSADYEMAIEEGSNMVRIGTAIFGPRLYNV
jgi:pyridoxal phosphate enzyme (YggS family)